MAPDLELMRGAMKFVHDTGSLLASMPAYVPGESYTVKECIEEVKDKDSRRSLEVYSEKLKVLEPKEESVRKVKEAAKELGERLSDTDVKVIALALDLDATVLSDDYGVLNVATYLGLNARPVRTKGIKENVMWVNYCPFCKVEYPPDVEVCPRCGAKVVRRPRFKAGGRGKGRR